MTRNQFEIDSRDIEELRGIFDEWEAEGLIVQDMNAITRICNIETNGIIGAEGVLAWVVLNLKPLLLYWRNL